MAKLFGKNVIVINKKKDTRLTDEQRKSNYKTISSRKNQYKSPKKDKKKETSTKKTTTTKKTPTLSTADYEYMTSGQIGYNGTDRETTLSQPQREFLSARRANSNYTGFDEKKKANLQSREDATRSRALVRTFSDYGAKEYAQTGLEDDRNAVSGFLRRITNPDGTINTKKFISQNDFADALESLGRLQGYASHQGLTDEEEGYKGLFDVIADPENGLKNYYSYFNDEDEYKYFTETDESGKYKWNPSNLIEEYESQTDPTKKRAAFSVYAQRADDNTLDEGRKSAARKRDALIQEKKAREGGTSGFYGIKQIVDPNRPYANLTMEELNREIAAANGLVTMFDTEIGKRAENKRIGRIEADANDIAQRVESLPNFEFLSQPKESATTQGANQSFYYNLNFRKDEMLGGTPYWYITDSELKVYNALYNTEGPASADQYIETLTPILNKRMVTDDRKSFEEFSKEHPYISTAVSVPMNLLAGITGTASAVGQKLSGEEIDPYSTGFYLQHATGTVRDTAKQEITDGNYWGGILYDSATNIADMATTIAVSSGLGGVFGGGASVINSALLGSQVFSSTVMDAKMRGLSDTQALALATSAAAVEVITEKIGFDRVTGLRKSGNAFAAFIKNGLPEALEESTSNLINSALDRIIAKGQSHWNRDVDKYIQEGYDAAQAMSMVYKDNLMEIAREAAIAVISGGFIGGGAAAVNAPYIREQGRQISNETLNNLVQTALKSPNTESGKIALSLQKKLEKGKTVSDVQKGSFLASMIQDGNVSTEDVQQMVIRDRALKFYEEAGKSDPDASIQEVIELLNPEELGVSTEEAVEAITRGIKQGRTISEKETEPTETEKTKTETLVKTENAPDVTPAVLKAPAENSSKEIEKLVEESETETAQTVAEIYRDVRKGKISSAGKEGMVAYAENKELIETALEKTGTSKDMAKRESDTVFAFAYTSGINGKTFSAETIVKEAGINSAVLSQPGVVNSLKLYYMAGKSDVERARNIKYWGENSGIQKDATYHKVLRKFGITYSETRKLDALGKVVGHKVVFVEGLKNKFGQPGNAVVDPSTGTIKIDPSSKQFVLNGAIHEVVHSLRETDPTSYNKLASVVLDIYGEGSTVWEGQKGKYKRQIEGASKEYASDYVSEEVVAKALGTVLQDSNMLDRFVKTDRNLAQKVLEYLHDLITKINYWVSGKAKLNEKQKQDFSELKTEITALEGLLHDALNKRARLHEGVENEVEGKSEERYSIVENIIDNDNNQYDKAVLLDTDFFNGLNPRNWGKKLKQALIKRITKSTTIMPILDENNNIQMLEFAGLKERASKNGGENHIVIDKLVRTKDNLSKLAVIHIDEIVEISEESNPYYTQKSEHGWLEQRGWLHRKAFVINSVNGKIYELTLDIAKTRDGRIIMYTTGGKIKEVGQTQIGSIAKKAKGTRSHSNFNSNSTTKTPKSQGQNTERSDLADSEYLELAKDPMKNKAELEKMVEEAAREAGYNSPMVYHATSKENGEFYVFDYSKAKRKGGLGFKALGKGNYFSTNNLEGTRYGERIISAYLKIEKPFVPQGDFYESVKNELGIEGTYDEIQKQMKRLGFDGVVSENGSIFVTFDSNQIKSADPVIYDDNGNIIPLSERFNTKKDDIRWDLADGVDNSSDDEYNINIENNESNGIDDAVSIIPRQDIVFVGMYRSLVRKKGFKEKLLKAKQGDLKAAKEIVDSVLTKKFLMQVEDKYANSILIPLNGYADTSENILPQYLANYISQSIGLPCYNKIYKITKNNMKSKPSNIRLTSKMDFDFDEGGVSTDIVGKHFVLVDDVVSTGTTLTALKDFIKSNGGVVDGYIALAKGKDSSDDLAILSQQLKKLVEIAKQEDTDILEKFTEEDLYGTFKELTARQAETAIRHPEIIGRILDTRGRSGYVSKNSGESGDFNGNVQRGYRTDAEGVGRGQEKLNTLTENDERFDLADDWNQKIDEFGTVPKGEKPARDIDVPNKIRRDRPISRFARTMMEAGVTPNETISEFEKAILDGTMTHEVITDKKAEAKAISDIKYDGFKESLVAWDVLVRKGKIGKEELAFGMTLYNQCVQNKDTRNAMKIAADLVAEATSAGQTLQACRLLKKMTPDGQLYYLEKSVKKMNEEFREKLGERFKDIELDDNLLDTFLTTENGESRDYLYDRICQDIADQIPSTFRDKWNSWRYLAMLGNPRTHIRNIVGNGIFAPVIKIKNFVAAVTEAGLEKAGVIKTESRTKAIVKSKESVKFAKEDFKNMVNVLQGQDAKYATTGDIESKRKIFKTKLLEFLRKKNFDFLEAEDMWFLKRHYVDALASAITARKIDVDKASPKMLEELRAYAVEQAQMATYRDANSFAEALTRIQRKAATSKNGLARAGGYLLEGVMPFKKTPMNIAKQGINYSFVSVVKGVYKIIKKLKNGKAFSATEIIDDFAKGFTGTGLLLLGVYLASQGWLTGGGDDDENKRRFDKLTGEQTYAFTIGNHSYTIDWAVPACLPLFVGFQVYKLATADGLSTRDVFEALSTLSDPLLELSVFSGVKETLENIGYNKEEALFAIPAEIATSYVLQGLPTIGGQFARILDPTKRNYYYDDKNSPLPKVVQNFIGQASSKIPFVTKLFEASVDDWGREEKYGNLFERIAENLVSPGYYSKTKQTAVDKEIYRLYETTGESSVFPSKQEKSYADGGETYHMSAKEYTEAKKTNGSVAFNLIDRLIKGETVLPKQEKSYAEMTDEEKVKAIKKCYELANDTTKATMLGKLKTKSDAHNLTKSEYQQYSKDANVIYNKTSKYLDVIFSLPDYSNDKRFAQTIDSYARTYAEETALRDASGGKYKVSDWVKTAESYGDGEGAAGYILWMSFEEAYGRDGAAEKLSDDKIVDTIPEEVWEDMYISKSYDNIVERYNTLIDNSDVDLSKYLKSLSFYNATSSDKDENGNPITNSKKRKVQQFILSQGWPTEEAELIFDGFYKKGSVYGKY